MTETKSPHVEEVARRLEFLRERSDIKAKVVKTAKADKAEPSSVDVKTK